MYTAYFGLLENPFKLTPDQRFLFLSRNHIRALNHLRYGIKERKGFIVISGGVGTGKTTLCRTLLNELNPSTKSAFIFNTSLSDMELLATINQEFGIKAPAPVGTKKRLVDLLNRFLLSNFRKGGNAVLIIDEAQNLSRRALEQLRMLSNLETDREKLIQIVLVGQTELMTILSSSNLRQLNDRITVRFHLEPLDRQEMQDYIEHRLVVAGNRGNVTFTKGAIKALYSHSRGNPRRINAVCDRALLIAYCRDEFAIGKNTIHKAVADIQGDFSAVISGPRWLQKRLAPAAVVLVMAFMIANLGGWNLMTNFSGLFSAVEKVATVQGRAFVHNRPIESAQIVRLPERPVVRKPIEDQRIGAALALRDRASLATLFRLFDVQEAESRSGTGEVYPGLFSFKGDPELYRMFVRPFRIRIKSPPGESSRYLLIKRITTGGAIALDSNGKERPVTEDFILANWDGEISWIYPYEQISNKLLEGMSGLAVLRIQQMLQQMGYSIEPRGIFDEATFEQVTRFQLNFGLRADGVVDTSTKALLYEMSGQA